MIFNRFILFIIVFCFSALAHSQTDCECEDETIIVCYLSNQKYCLDYTNSNFGCGYTLDGRHMEDYLRPKLENSANFGANGIVSCDIELKELTNISSVQAIESQNCDIIFVGGFSIDTLTGANRFDFTSIPDNELRNINEWSQKCLANLVIITQSEANIWGYFVDNLNLNPNFPSSFSSQLSIFNGPFGVVPSFNQGGSFRGVFTVTPNTGFTILGRDANNRPTAILDELTNDIIMGDIGIFCGGSVGDISFGANVNNNNDKLACNIFGLSCEIVSSGNFVRQNFEICMNQPFIRPNGQIVFGEGVYFDTLMSSNFCDSVIRTELSIADTLRNMISYEGCEDDGYSIVANNVTYNQSKPKGVEKLKARFGCDSLITIDLIFNSNSESFIYEDFCSEENHSITVGNTVFDESNTSGVVPLMNAAGCDSTATVELNFYPPLPNVTLDSDINVVYGDSYNLDLALPTSVNVRWEPAQAVDCPSCAAVNLNTLEYYPEISVTVFDDFNCEKRYTFNLTFECPIYIPNIFSPNELANERYSIGTTCPFDVYDMKIFDRWGQLIFQSDDPSKSWDGRKNNKELTQGVYVFVLEYDSFGNQVVETGQITLIR